MFPMVLIAVLAMGFAIAPAYADDIQYTLRGVIGGGLVTFTLPEDPTPIATNADWFAVSTTVTDNGVPSTEDITFFDTNFLGGLLISSTPEVDGLLDQIAAQYLQLYSGTTSNPELLTFTNLPLTCSYVAPAATSCAADTDAGTFTLNAVDVPSTTAPEPSAFALTLVGAGLLGLMMAIRKRKTHRAALAS
jgi:hypothetical protein